MAGTRGRTGWRVASSVIAGLMIAFGTANAVSALAHETWQERRVIQEPVTILDVVNSTGGIVMVVGDDAVDRVTIDMTVSRGLQAPAHTERIEGNRAVVRGRCLWVVSVYCQIDYRIRVPAGVSVVAHADGRSVEVSNVTGFLDLVSDGGNVEVLGGRSDSVRLDSDGGSVMVSGLSATSVDASASGGRVLLDLASAPLSVTASSDGGDVEIVLPDTTDTYRVDISSDGGSTRADVRTYVESDRLITAHSSGGDVTVRYR
ncbi:MAG TPA: DUF4097 family beta strand repeat-containing protein [Actinomycetota bacterium]|nr:DUF4097 family beta strand repeat-containing protein [Actinomycetota bacterium]